MKDDNTYEMFNPLAKEFTFDVDMSNLPCGIAADAHFSGMEADGGMARSAGWNSAGPKYGTGYCDARCPRDLKWVNGVVRVPLPISHTSGVGRYGSCCAEVDLWQANSISTATTLHPCAMSGQYQCTDDLSDCGSSSPDGNRYGGVCYPDGCDYNPYRLDNPSYYGVGPGKVVDTRQKITVVTQFITDSGTPTGTLNEIRCIYVQNGLVISNAAISVSIGVTGNSMNDAYCNHQKLSFGDTNSFQSNGGFGAISRALSSGMVLALSIYDDLDTNLLWLDSNYPPGATGIGTSRGTCSVTSGIPADVEAQYPNASVTFSNIRFGPIGSTY
ncbi:glycoside hydrolase family 7 protein [Tulasnella calospora MUT 4182]|uniref:Glucanase n=1 Tax=Tulasnella calospora MUT 4182 TaxID=1051891 RepID=A0A0C3QJN8_9AGAM|nr:glycoside hydrolase family 7 protein [Tulasnella calospora MUT 4182]